MSHEVTMAAMQRSAAPPEHTVGLTWNAKGDVQIEVTGRGSELAALVEGVADYFDVLRARYPRNGVSGPAREPRDV